MGLPEARFTATAKISQSRDNSHHGQQIPGLYLFLHVPGDARGIYCNRAVLAVWMKTEVSSRG